MNLKKKTLAALTAMAMLASAVPAFAAADVGVYDDADAVNTAEEAVIEVLDTGAEVELFETTELPTAVDGVIQLTDSTSIDSYTVTEATTIDLNGQTLTLTGSISAAADLTIKDSSTGGTITNADTINDLIAVTADNVNITVESGTLNAGCDVIFANGLSNVTVTVDGGSLNATGTSGNDVIHFYGCDSCTATINGGALTTKSFIIEGSLTTTNCEYNLNGGYYKKTAATSYGFVNLAIPTIKDGCEWTAADGEYDGYYTIAEYTGDTVATVNGTGYTTLRQAFAAAEDGDTVKLAASYTIPAIAGYGYKAAAEVTKNVTFDLAGYTVTVDDTNGSNVALFYVHHGAELTIEDSVGNGMINATYRSSYVVRNSGSVVVNSGTIQTTGYGIDSDPCYKMGYDQYSTYRYDYLSAVDTSITVNGGTFIGNGSNQLLRTTGQDPAQATIEINDGTFTNGKILVSGSDVTVNGGTFSTSGSESLFDVKQSTTILATLTINDGSFTSSGTSYVVSVGEGGTAVINDGTLTSETSQPAVYVSNSNSKYPAEVIITGGTISTSTGTNAVKVSGTYADLTVSGGTINTDITDYLADKCHQLSDGTVELSYSDVVESATGAGYDIVMDGLYENLSTNGLLDKDEIAVYKVKIATASESDTAAAKELIAANEAADYSNCEIFDLSVVKVVNGVETEVSGVENQDVTISIQREVNDDKIKVFHVDSSGTAKEVSSTSIENSSVSFTAESFSTYAVVYDADDLDATEITGSVEIAFEKVTDNVFDIIVQVTDSKQINRLTSVDLTFANSNSAVGYTIEPAAKMTLIDAGDGRYEFNFDGINAASATGDAINIGTVTFTGNGSGEFYVDTNATTNVVHATTAVNNIVADYIPSGSTYELSYANSNVAEYNVSLSTTTLTINVMFPNALDDVAGTSADYTSMSVNMDSLVLDDETIALCGSGKSVLTSDGTTEGTATVTSGTYDIGGETYTGYIVTATVALNYATTLTFEGDGYRTYRVTVVPTAATGATVTVWNNAMDEDNKVTVATGCDTTSDETVTFLAGDIVANNVIDLYDLSAVVSYFGKTDMKGDATAYKSYITYDLNRDGKIDSKDIAMVLVSWGK